MPDRHRLSQNEALALRERDHLVELLRIESDRLLDEQVLAVLQRLFHEAVVSVVRTGDIDDVDIVVREHLVDCPVDLSNAILFGKSNSFGMRAVADRVQGLAHLLQPCGHFIRDHAGSENCPVHIF